jgi:hypothetical protein
VRVREAPETRPDVAVGIVRDGEAIEFTAAIYRGE